MIKRFFFTLLLLTLLSTSTFAQKPKPKSNASKKSVSADLKTAGGEQEALDKALAETDLARKIAGLNKFNKDFPRSEKKTRVSEIILAARVQLADEKLRAGDKTNGIGLFRQAVANAPNPISDKLFSEIVVQIPTNLFYRGEQAAAIEIARAIEEKIGGDAKQLLGLANFYLGTENAAEARRLAAKSTALEPTLPDAYQTLGMANRMDFRLEDSAAAYARALELDPNSTVAKRSLAEMKRATGKTDEAVALYRELLEKAPDDANVQAGLVLSLFNAEKQPEAEAELAKALAKTPNNLSLLVGAAYWYAAHQQGEKALEYARQAVALEPRYTWGHIALARAFLVQKNPLDAEKELLVARQYGNFPTLDYEIAAARLAAGFYEEAARELKKSFVVKNDSIETRLGYRVPKQAKNFIELIELERRASIFEPLAADSPDNAEKLKSLLRLNQTLASDAAPDDEIAQAVGEFVKGDDKAKIHRELYAASRLLQAKKSLPKVLELTQSAIGGVDTALDVPSAGAAVMADELFESRTLAIAKKEVLIVPDVPRQTLLSVLRGRIEEITGWALYQQQKPQEASVRLKRAVSVLPEKSAWWRSSIWKLGVALDAAGKQPEALDAYMRNYVTGEPDAVKYSVIETLYQKINGNTEGLAQKIGAKPVNSNAVASIQNETATQPTEIAKTEIKPNPTTAIAVAQTPEASATPKVETAPETLPAPKIEAKPTPEITAQAETEPEVKPEVSPSVKTEPASVSAVETTPENKPTPTATPEIKPDAVSTNLPSSEIKTESPETKTIESREKLKNPESDTKSAAKSLFEPIVITVPKPEALKTSASTSTGDKSSDSAKTDEFKFADKSSESTAAANNSVGSRPRLANSNNQTTKSSASETPACELTISQDSLTILNQSGGIGVLLGFRGEGGDITKVTAASSSPNDIEIALEPDIGKNSNRSFFIIKSISSNKGAYTVTFDSPCGKKEVLVKVR